MPPVLQPETAVQPQAVATRHCFVAGAEGAVVCLSGGCAAECLEDSGQVLRCGVRSRPLRCCALSPCSRFLAAGESGGVGRGPQVLVFDTLAPVESPPVALLGHRHGVRLVAWSHQGSLLLSAGEAENEQAGDHLVLLWSWPQAELLAVASCARGLVDLAFAPDAAAFVTLGTSTVRRWSIVYKQDLSDGARNRNPVQLVGRPLSVEAKRLSGAEDGRQRLQLLEDAFVAVAWGAAPALHLLTEQGVLCTVVEDCISRCTELGQKANALRWSEQLCGTAAFSEGGVLACALAAGSVHVFDAGTLRSMAALAAREGAPEALGVSISPSGEALWVLYADRSLARWQDIFEPADCVLPMPVAGLRHAQGVPGCVLPQMVSGTDRWLQLWTSRAAGPQLESQVRPAPPKAGEITALACSPWIAACGYSSGEVHLVAIPGLLSLEPVPVRHGAEVVALCFGPWRAASGVPLLLASAGQDRSVMVFRIDLRRGAVAVEASSAVPLLQLSVHPWKVQCLALAGGAEAETASQLAVLTADRNLHLHDLDLSLTGASVKRSHRVVLRGPRWVGLCAHPGRPALYAACADRRVMQLDSRGCALCHVRVGGPELELTAPVRLDCEGRWLAAGLAFAVGSSSSGCGPTPPPPSHGHGVILFDVQDGLRPLLRLSGNAELPGGLAFLRGGRVLGAWGDGTMLVWEMPSEAGGATAEVQREARTSATQPRSGRTTPALRRASSSSASLRMPEGLLERLLAASPRASRWGSASATSLGVPGDEAVPALPAMAPGGAPIVVASVALSARERQRPSAPALPIARWGRVSGAGERAGSNSETRGGRSQVPSPRSASPPRSPSPTPPSSWSGHGGAAQLAGRRSGRGTGSQLRAASEGTTPGRAACLQTPHSLPGGSSRPGSRPGSPTPKRPLRPPPQAPPLPGMAGPATGAPPPSIDPGRLAAGHPAAPPVPFAQSAPATPAACSRDCRPSAAASCDVPQGHRAGLSDQKAAAQLRGDIQRLCADVARVLSADPEASSEVTELLRRADALLLTQPPAQPAGKLGGS